MWYRVAMNTKATCKGCGIELTAASEDELVTKLQQHIAEAHPKGHSPSRKHILAVIRRQARDER
jgi:predicted small metal-binding protein